MRICIDMGHTPASPGASGLLDELYEDRIIGRRLIDELSARGHSVIDTTAPDWMAYPGEVNHRVSVANGSGAGLFLSVHLNAGGGTGAEVLHFPGDGTGRAYAARISANLAKTLGLPDRGAKGTTAFGVIRDTSMTAILVEVCFVDSAADKAAYDAVSYEAIACAIADGIVGVVSDAPSAPAVPAVWDGPGTRLEGATAAETCAVVADYAHPDAEHTLRAKYHQDAVAGMWRAGQLGARTVYGDTLLALDGYITAGQVAFGTQRFFAMSQRDIFGASLGDTCLVCSHTSVQDMAAAGSVSYLKGWPVVYYEDHANFYGQLKWYKNVIVVGGTAAIPAFADETDRIAGDTGGATMAAVAERYFADWGRVAVANGAWDSVAACQIGVPVLMADAAETVAAIKSHKPKDIVWVGGLGAVSYDRRTELCKAAELM